MHVLVFGAGVIGQVYAGRLSQAGHDVAVVARGSTASRLREDGIRLRRDGRTTTHRVAVVDPGGQGAETPGVMSPDALLVCVRRDQLTAALAELRRIHAQLTLVLMNTGDDPDTVVDALGRERTVLAFPGVGGRRQSDGPVDYLEIAQQPTTIATGTAGSGPARELLTSAGFPVADEPDMPSWLATHTVFVTLLGAGILSRHGDPVALSRDRAQVREVVTAIREGFRALRADGVIITPRALRVLFLTMPRWFATAYWCRALRGPVGTVAIAPHLRATAATEFPPLCADVLRTTCHGASRTHLTRLIDGVLATAAATDDPTQAGTAPSRRTTRRTAWSSSSFCAFPWCSSASTRSSCCSETYPLSAASVLSRAPPEIRSQVRRLVSIQGRVVRLWVKVDGQHRTSRRQSADCPQCRRRPRRQEFQRRASRRRR